VQSVRVAGKHCECDNLIFEINLPEVDPGDILAVQTTGAYNFSMASNYNRFRRPAVVLVNDGNAEVIVERQTLDDLLSHDVVPERLKTTCCCG
jgi:diaminopimelate decarboxylase